MNLGTTLSEGTGLESDLVNKSDQISVDAEEFKRKLENHENQRNRAFQKK
jgi:hypothetical protein